MKIIILEDEFAAKRNLISIISKLDNDIKILAVLESVNAAYRWLKENEHPDLGFFDVQLSDNIVFELFKKIEIKFPIIFTTAFSEYAINAFKVNSIDYILKPINEESIRFALDKYRSIEEARKNILSEDKLKKILLEFNKGEKEQYKKSLLVHYKDKLIPVRINDFAFFYIDSGIVYGQTISNKRYTIDRTLDQVETYLDPTSFKRASRQFIINKKAIKEVGVFFNGRYTLKTSPASPEKIIISKARSSEFLTWLEK